MAINWEEKLTSRKFWLAVAAGLGSIGTSIAGLATDNEVIAATGIICATASAAIYAAAEAYTDGKRAEANSVTTEITETKALSETKAVNVASNSAALASAVLTPQQESAPAESPGGTE